MSIGAPPVGVPPSMSTPGSLTGLMDGLVALQATVPDHPLLAPFHETLNLARWEPDQPDLPGLWNWMLPSSSEMRDLSRIRDSITIATRIGIQFTDVEDRMAFVEACADAYRAITDPAFWNGQAVPAPFKDWATWGIRTQMQSWTGTVGGVPCVGIEFVQSFFLDRHIR